MKLKEFMKKYSVDEGAVISFEFGGRVVEGTIIPSRDETLMIKLNTGYNAGFDVSKISNVKTLGKSKGVGKGISIVIKKNPDLPTICILHTGGTIASRVNY